MAKRQRAVTAKRKRKAEVISLYRAGDRVLVEQLCVCYEVTVRHSEFRDGRLWLYGAGVGCAMVFPAAQVIRRLGPGEAVAWAGGGR